jgi:hypothetical protein
MTGTLEVMRDQVRDVRAVFDQKDASHGGILMNL